MHHDMKLVIHWSKPGGWRKHLQNTNHYLREWVSKYRTSPFFKREDVYSGFLSPLSATTLTPYLSLDRKKQRDLIKSKLTAHNMRKYMKIKRSITMKFHNKMLPPLSEIILSTNCGQIGALPRPCPYCPSSVSSGKQIYTSMSL